MFGKYMIVKKEVKILSIKLEHYFNAFFLYFITIIPLCKKKQQYR